MDVVEYITMYMAVPIISAIIGTYWGARRLNKYNEDQKNTIRNLAKRAIEIFKKYAKKIKPIKWLKKNLIQIF